MNDNNEKFWNRREAEAELIIERLVEAGMEWKVMTAGSFACRFWLLWKEPTGRPDAIANKYMYCMLLDG